MTKTQNPIFHIIKSSFSLFQKRLAFVLLLFGNLAFSQQPAYFILGADQFKGVQIYDVIQDKDLNYWFATNEGLFYFDYLHYEKVECDESKNNSLFGFKIDKEGNIYCHNLNHQIFQIVRKKCSLFYELKTDEAHNDIVLAIANDDNVIVGGRKIIVLNKNKSVVQRYELKKSSVGVSFLRKDKKTQFHISGTDSVLLYSYGVFTKHRLHFDSKTHQAVSNNYIFFNLKNNSFALDLGSKNIFKFDQFDFSLSLLPKDKTFERSPSVRLNSTGDEAWVGGTLPGLNLLTEKSSSQVYYQDYFISDILKNEEGNFLLSTFYNGVLVIPDLKISDVVRSFRDDPIATLYSDNDLGLLLGSSTGNLNSMSSEGSLKNLSKTGKRPINVLQGDPRSDLVLFDDGFIKAYDKNTGKIFPILQSSLKDAVFTSKTTFYLGTNNGIHKFKWLGANNFLKEQLNGFENRVYSLEYDPNEKLIYTTTANGMFVIDSLGEKYSIQYLGKDIFPNTLHYFNGKIYAADKKNGILVIEKVKIVSAIAPIVNRKKVTITKMLIFKNTILAKTTDGLFQFDLNGKLIKSIHSLFGISAKRILDFTIHQNYLWVSHSEGVQKVDLSYDPSKSKFPDVRIDRLLINDEEKSLNQVANFESNKRKIQFVLSLPTLQNHETIHYHYKLEGYETEWNITNYDLNKVTYNALAPGKYSFLVKAENQGKFSKTISYSFNIAQPYYLKWWFIGSIISLFLVFVFMIYRWQLNIQQRKSKQLNEINVSKLTAIQSQMNPHFIFNALNSIQDLVLKGDIENSYSYITTFSNLVRRTLNYSERDFIDFDQEIKLLELYLSLEKLRFKKDFNFEIIVKNVDEIMLPPLLVQPFIENSLVHGLLHKHGEKSLKITFELKDILICIVEDNGIGREKSKIIKQRQRPEHESFSGKAIHNRFNILSKVYAGEYGYTYEDLYQNNEPSGTRVTLHIPVTRKF
ncbi:sensor histidine kinase [Aurantibacillus circumpalustris]|uniref:sensor histidine kinase n=1 Tax=Aurantibacillus circumpalustris TaxID=3036359 RepID=UPI00295BBF58|nr:histidine kinase [Aurantibacillus circumpalustris]